MDERNKASVTQQAAYWCIRWEDAKRLTRRDKLAFIRWLKATPQHIAELLRVWDVARTLCSHALVRYAVAVVATTLLSSGTTSLARSDQAFPAGQTVLQLKRTDQGQVISANRAQFLRIAHALQRDPDVVHQIHWRQWEELVAAAYDLKGFEVILTPRSNDGGRDVIATRSGAISVKVFDQVKAYSAGRLVAAHDVFALLGVLGSEANVSKAVITTTSDFAPGVYKDSRLQQLIPYRLELRQRSSLLAWISQLAKDCQAG